MGDNVETVGNYAFRSTDFSSLTSLTLGSSVTSIGTDAFRNATALTSVVIPDSVTSIGTYEFR